MVLVLLIPMRKIFRFENLITMEVLENIGKTIILTGLIVGYSYAVEHFMAWYGGGKAEEAQYMWRMTGYYSWCFWLMIVCNAVVPIFLFFKKIRTSLPALFSIGILVNIGMWFERLVIIAGSEAHEYDPYSWGVYKSIHCRMGHPSWFLQPVFLSFPSFREVSPNHRDNGGKGGDTRAGQEKVRGNCDG